MKMVTFNLFTVKMFLIIDIPVLLGYVGSFVNFDFRHLKKQQQKNTTTIFQNHRN